MPERLLAAAASAVLLGVVGIAAAHAQSAADPIFDDWAPDAEADASHRAFGDVALRIDRVTGFTVRDDVERLRGRLRVGWRGLGATWEYGAALKLGLSSDDNRDNVRNNDNERSDAAGIDQLFWRWLPNDSTALTLGKSPLPLSLTPLVWDTDLRPVGISLHHERLADSGNGLRAVAGYFAGDHLYGDDSRIAAAQLAWLYQVGAPFSADIQLAYLDFSSLERATAQGLTRTNRRVGSRLLSDYRLLDLQFGARWQLGEKPLQARLDLLRNLGADDQDDGVRASLVYGDADRFPGWELGLSWQRIQRDAAMAAFNEDDWWFHSFARGVMPWAAYGFSNGWALQASLFVERRDAADETLRRVLIDVRRDF